MSKRAMDGPLEPIETGKELRPVRWVSDFERCSADELKELLWTYQPGVLLRYERNKKHAEYPREVNIISFGPARAGKSSYINSLLTALNADAETTQVHSELGSDHLTGTTRLEGPFPILDPLGEPRDDPQRAIVNLFTTMGISSTSEGVEFEAKYLAMIENCLIGNIRPGQFGGLADAKGDPLMKSNMYHGAPQYHLAWIMARYGNSKDAELAKKLYNLLCKRNNVPCAIIVTHAGDHVAWSEMEGVDYNSVFYVENYLPCELIYKEKNKRLLIPLLESLKKIERSDVFFSRATISPKQRAERLFGSFDAFVSQQMHVGQAVVMAVLFSFFYALLVLITHR